MAPSPDGVERPLTFEPAAVEPLDWPALPIRRKFQDRVWLHVLLFLLTVASTTYAGIGHYLSYKAAFSTLPPGMTGWQLILGGFAYSATILAILGCHELGHYYACRYYDVDASRPFFLPVPVVLTGTLGAVIRIREPIPAKRMLFDIGIAGPIAGFLVAVPALVIGMLLSPPIALPDPLPDGTVFFGEPLLYKAVSWLVWGRLPAGYDLNMHPILFAGWFGLLATALNLFPIGQLDGGHISYSVLGRWSSRLTLVMVGVAMILAYYSLSWIVWTVLIVVMLFAFGRHHPPVFDEDVPLDPTRRWLALFALVMLIVCFTPAPMELLDVIRP